MADGSRKHLLDDGYFESETDKRPKRYRGYNEGHSPTVRSGGQKQLRYKDYAIAVICALEFEMSAVRYMLNDEHFNLPSVQGDPNLYVLGELSGHNVVIACLPGNRGKGAAAIATTNMARTFPKIEQRLLVGLIDTNLRGFRSVFDSLELTTQHLNDHLQWNIESLQDLFRQAIESLQQISVVCFIDALDECEEKQIRDMLRFFEDVGKCAVDSRMRFLILFSSRHYPHITIKKGLELVLEGQEGHNQDIADYLGSELKIGSSALATQIRDEVQAKASGIFMWVVLVVQILNKEYDRGRVHALRQKLRSISSDLHELFRDILKRDGDNRDELLLYYAVRNVLHHADLAAGNGIDQKAFLQDFSLAYWNRLNNLFEKSKVRQHTPNVSLLYILAENNLSNLIESCPSNLSWLETENEHYRLPLFAALACGGQEAIRTFLRVYARSKPSRSMLHDLHRQYIIPWNIKVVFGRDFEFSGQRAILSYLAELGDEVLFAVLFDTGRFTPDSEHKGKRTSLSWAAGNGSQKIVKLLLADQRVELNAQDDEYGRTPLSRAAENGHGSIVKLLLVDQRVERNPRSKHGQTPLSLAARYGREAAVMLLLADHRVDPDSRDVNGQTPLSRAAGNNCAAAVKLLSADPRVELTAKDENEQTRA